MLDNAFSWDLNLCLKHFCPYNPTHMSQCRLQILYVCLTFLFFSSSSVKTVVGKDCKVTDPLYHITFDLSHLQKAGDHDYTVSAGEYNYLINVCAPLITGSGDCQGAGACQTKTQADGSMTNVSAGM